MVVERSILIGLKYFAFYYFRDSNWFQIHVQICRPLLIKKQTADTKLSNCYVLLENLSLPQDSQYKDVTSNTSVLEALQLDLEDKQVQELAEDLETLMISTTEDIQQKDKEMFKSISYSMRDKIIL